MKKSFYLATLLTIVTLYSCSELDKQGRLPVEKLTSASGSLKFFAMIHNDSASVLEFVPDTFFYKGEPYTGAVAKIEKDTLATVSGYLKNGLMDSTWTFRFKSGDVQMEGTMKNGLETGLWKSYYGYSKPKVEKLYDENGFMLMRLEYFENGRVKDYQNINCPQFGNRERRITFDSHGVVQTAYIEDSLLQLGPGELAEKVGENMFMRKK